MPFMYILECCDGSFYTGSTVNLAKRLKEHETGVGANHTKKRLPVKLVYFEEYKRVDEAFYREKHVQGWTHKKKKALVEGNHDALPGLAKKVFRTVASVKQPKVATQPPKDKIQKALPE
jgi:putative endonuclease